MVNKFNWSCWNDEPISNYVPPVSEPETVEDEVILVEPIQKYHPRIDSIMIVPILNTEVYFQKG